MHGNILLFGRLELKCAKTLLFALSAKQECRYSGSTLNLNEHLKRHHTEAMPLSGKKSIQSQITTMMKQPIVKLAPASKSLYYECVAEYICGDLAPLSTVESKHFRGILSAKAVMIALLENSLLTLCCPK